MAQSYPAMGVEGEGLKKNTGLTRWGETQLQFYFCYINYAGDGLYSFGHDNRRL